MCDVVGSIMAKMGFNEPKLAKTYNNRRERAEIGGKICNFRSQLEKRVAEILELQKISKHIKDWEYETHTFTFPDDKWLIDFVVRENDDSFYYIEAKGHFEARDRRKLKLLAKYRPEVRVLYIMQSQRDIKRMGLAGKKYLTWRKPITISDFKGSLK